MPGLHIRSTAGEPGLVQDFFFAFFRDKGLEGGDDFVAAGHDGVHFILGQIAFGFSRQFIGLEGFQFFEELAVALHQVFRGAQVLVLAEGAAEIDAPNAPIFAN